MPSEVEVTVGELAAGREGLAQAAFEKPLG
jgi:hypothetical protein